MIARLVECTDYDYGYGILVVKDKTAQEVQKEIYRIKQSFFDVGKYDWTIEDVLSNSPTIGNGKLSERTKQ